MKMKYLFPVLLMACLSISFSTKKQDSTPEQNTRPTIMTNDSVLRHVVLFKFKDGTSESDIAKVQDAFSALPKKIPEIAGYEWGLNNSPEGLEKGFTHCFFLTFKSEEDRATYLPHPDHKAFGEVLGPHLDDVLVIDYWAKE